MQLEVVAPPEGVPLRRDGSDRVFASSSVRVVLRRCAGGDGVAVDVGVGRAVRLRLRSIAEPRLLCGTESGTRGSRFAGGAVDLADLRRVDGGASIEVVPTDGLVAEISIWDNSGGPCAIPGWFELEALLVAVRPDSVMAVGLAGGARELADAPGARVVSRVGDEPLVVEAPAASFAAEVLGVELWPGGGETPSVVRGAAPVCLRREFESCPPAPSGYR